MTTLSVAAGGSSSGPATPSPDSNRRYGSNHVSQHDDSVLTFTEIPSDLFQLRSFESNDRQLTTTTTTPNSRNNATSPQPPTIVDDNSTSNSPPSASHHPQPRKPSPGLAARLKALGFGGQRKSSPPPPSHLDRIGRLPEEQLRKLDQGYQAASTAPVIERRGRPWKAAIARIPSRSSLKPTPPKDDHSFDGPELENINPVHDGSNAGLKPELLPEIPTLKPVEMDTHKYRLPDHTNGNGVKVQLETREEHLARDSRPLPSPEILPPLPPKDTPPLPSVDPTAQQDVFNPDATSYFNPLGLQRPGSIYTLSRVSFASQLAQLTSIQLPDAESLSSKVSAIPTAQAATKALIGAAEQIRGWVSKASEVIDGLESEDDVEWAAAGGREGVEEVENAIIRFEELINVYVSAIEDLQGRSDISQVSTNDLQRAVAQMESIMNEWSKTRITLRSVKAQVEIAMEWEELWDMVLGDIQNEMDDLSRLVFEMEERRHKSIMAVANGDGVDIGDLETIVEETPPAATRLQATNNRFSLPAFPASPSSPSPGAAAPTISQDDSSLLALFARMQPLRASLDFLPMRLSVFEARAQSTFPTSCEELEMRRSGLDASYQKLEKDAESLRKELGEDRWVLVFRGAGRQAQKMYESVERSVSRLKEAVDGGMHLTNQPMMSKKIESYEAKKTHYGPAIERVLGIIDKGVKDRLTVNGEILRLHTEMQAKWEELKERMSDMDLALDDLQPDRGSQQLRDSVSSMLSNDRSTIGSGNETPGSSPPSSVIMSSLGFGKTTAGPKTNKQRSTSIGSHLPQPAGRRNSSLPAPVNQGPRRVPMSSRLSTLSTPSREGSATPTGRRIPRPNSTVPGRPKWNGSTNASDVDTGHNFKPLSLTSPSPYAKRSPTPNRLTPSLTPNSSKLPLRSPLSRGTSASPIPEDTPPRSTASRLSFRERIASASASSQQTLPKQPLARQPPPKPRLASQSSMSTLANRRASLQPRRIADGSPDTTPRPASSLAASRRTSMLPQPRSMMGSITGRESPQALAGARSAMRRGSISSNDSRPTDNKPKWRP